MTKEQRDFYTENKEFINDIRSYYQIISKEFYYIINEVSGHTLESEFFNIGMIPFKPNINGILLDNENVMEFECKDIRAEIGSHLIDGAFMIDPFGNCSGIGLILSNPNSGKGNPERGSRYNSAVNYINNNKSSIAVVISEDGMIDIL